MKLERIVRKIQRNAHKVGDILRLKCSYEDKGHYDYFYRVKEIPKSEIDFYWCVPYHGRNGEPFQKDPNYDELQDISEVFRADPGDYKDFESKIRENVH